MFDEQPDDDPHGECRSEIERLQAILAAADDTLVIRALALWGADAQTDMAIEECAELIVALNHNRRGRATVTDVAGELADVYIMFRQMRHLFGPVEVDAAIEMKLGKLERRIKRNEMQRDRWLSECAKDCKCCSLCGEYPCSGCTAGGVCDAIECRCDDRSEPETTDPFAPEEGPGALWADRCDGGPIELRTRGAGPMMDFGPVMDLATPIGCERIPCECAEWPCTDCSGLGYHCEPLFEADFDVGLDSLRAELDPSYQEPGR